MNIKEYPIEYYIHRMQRGEHFSFPGFSDSEWFCMAQQRIGTYSGAGQLHTQEIGERLLTSLKKTDENWMPAVPKIIETYSEIALFNEIAGDQIFYERDGVTDDLASKPGGLNSFIRQLRKMDVYFIGNVHMKGLHFLKYKHFFEIESQYNFHLDPLAIDRKIDEILSFRKPGVYLFSVGMSDAVMISELHGKIPGAFLIDCGSIWDAFVGMGGNRGWRAELYNDTKSWVEWISSNLNNV